MALCMGFIHSFHRSARVPGEQVKCCLSLFLFTNGHFFYFNGGGFQKHSTPSRINCLSGRMVTNTFKRNFKAK